MRVYLVGSHCVGKTTIARHISKRFMLPMISEVARAILAEEEASLNRLRTDIETANSYQRKVFERQIEAEQHQTGGFVSDRAFDNLAYAAEHTTIVADLIATEGFLDYMRWVADGVVFFVRPHQALLSDDGVREKGTWEGVVRIDAMIKFVLEQFRVPYVPIEPMSHQERIRIIEYVLNLKAAAEGV